MSTSRTCFDWIPQFRLCAITQDYKQWLEMEFLKPNGEVQATERIDCFNTVTTIEPQDDDNVVKIGSFHPPSKPLETLIDASDYQFAAESWTQSIAEAGYDAMRIISDIEKRNNATPIAHRLARFVAKHDQRFIPNYLENLKTECLDNKNKIDTNCLIANVDAILDVAPAAVSNFLYDMNVSKKMLPATAVTYLLEHNPKFFDQFIDENIDIQNPDDAARIATNFRQALTHNVNKAMILTIIKNPEIANALVYANTSNNIIQNNFQTMYAKYTNEFDTALDSVERSCINKHSIKNRIDCLYKLYAPLVKLAIYHPNIIKHGLTVDPTLIYDHFSYDFQNAMYKNIPDTVLNQHISLLEKYNIPLFEKILNIRGDNTQFIQKYDHQITHYIKTSKDVNISTSIIDKLKKNHIKQLIEITTRKENRGILGQIIETKHKNVVFDLLNTDPSAADMFLPLLESNFHGFNDILLNKDAIKHPNIIKAVFRNRKTKLLALSPFLSPESVSRILQSHDHKSNAALLKNINIQIATQAANELIHYPNEDMDFQNLIAKNTSNIQSPEFEAFITSVHPTIQAGAAENPYAVTHPKFGDLITHRSPLVRRSVARNPAAPNHPEYCTLVTDPNPTVRSSVALNANAVTCPNFKQLFQDDQYETVLSLALNPELVKTDEFTQLFDRDLDSQRMGISIKNILPQMIARNDDAPLHPRFNELFQHANSDVVRTACRNPYADRARDYEKFCHQYKKEYPTILEVD